MAFIKGLSFAAALTGSIVSAAPAAVDPLSSQSQRLAAATPTALPPPDIANAASRIASVFAAQATDNTIVEIGAELIEAGLTPSNVGSAAEYLAGFAFGENSQNNLNFRNPVPAAYPRAGPLDAPYSISESMLRGAIYIPRTFQYGRAGAPQPVILVPGTGNTGYISFQGNMIPLLESTKAGDPVWLNIPKYQLQDAQLAAEYVAYAINYIYGISNRRNPAVFAWSQGALSTQWALKYWPSTNPRTTDLVAFSGDYHGTIFADYLAAPGEPLPPSVLQQKYNADFVTQLRKNGGDSAYVPTTNIYSGFFDEIVQPQNGQNASAFLNDARGKGVSNNEAQVVCPEGSEASAFYSHEGMLYHPLSFALAVDALRNPGPGRPERLDLNKVCDSYLTDGLDLADFFITENNILVAGAAIVTYPAKVTEEPPIMAYAQAK